MSFYIIISLLFVCIAVVAGAVGMSFCSKVRYCWRWHDYVDSVTCCGVAGMWFCVSAGLVNAAYYFFIRSNLHG